LTTEERKIAISCDNSGEIDIDEIAGQLRQLRKKAGSQMAS
jgi:hypothetical protein